ncbi:hypothetical protein PAV_5c04280 [Paenibacillus alvei DSM 29]|nr:hypothetical protein PAV_5c04280 [Paenibacillus alvei DSM 29]
MIGVKYSHAGRSPVSFIMKRTWLADVCLLLVALIWGSTFLVVQHAVHTLPPLAFNAIRFIGAGLLFAVVLLARRSLFVFLDKRLLIHGSILGLWLFSAYAFQTIGLLYTTTTNTGFLTGLSVVLVPFITLWLAKQRLTLPTWISALLALCGLYLLAFNGGAAVWNQGDVLVLLCAVGFAMHIALTGRFAPHHDTLPLVTVQLTIVGILSGGSSLIFEPQLSTGMLGQALSEPKVLFALAVSIGLSTAFAFWAQTWCQRYTSATRVAILFAMEPVFAAITGVTFAGEVLGGWAIAGCGLIFAGMIVAELKWGEHAVQ